MSDIPEGMLQAAEDIAIEIGKTDGGLIEVTELISRALMAERERCAKLIEEGFDRGIKRKLDMCAHSKFSWEDCDQCCATAIRASTKDGK